MELWVCGRVIEATGIGAIWDLVGVFSNQGVAERACKGPHYFVGPVGLDQHLPEEVSEWPGAYYPLAPREGQK